MAQLYSLFVLFFMNVLSPADTSHVIGTGMHPSAVTDPAGAVHVVFGRGALIYYTTSADGHTFSRPAVVDSLFGLHLGASRGPQIAATTRSVVITAIDKGGDVWGYTLDRKTGRWQKPVHVTDEPEMAKEGFVALTAGPDDSFMAIWLDLRGNQQNKLMGAHSTDEGRTWSANRLVYESPSGTICECCQPSIVCQGRSVAVMFRNSMAGSRDMYLLRSSDGGHMFGKAEKLGAGTWKLNACPMDGGGVYMAPDGPVTTVWRRSDKLFTARPGQAETEVGTGRNAKIVSTKKGDYIAFQRDSHVWILAPGETQPRSIGEGGFPKLLRLSNDHVLCVWEQAGSVLTASI
ncbi:exo-alpha-sialidase [Spirosoma utsteinense]|uniref:Exo-alpha-sialidase n=1 Tax=Spirosoma utsteinense TaxID=2585773 RepID=A0ABR6VZH9_9BACT|nr:exo-alpha-sialidase [Spirosoma utsteinense]MBC3784513.1 hypothetical protein [Spirosoma utsteinense]MBC3789736.1 hypothetical protein [Spirosoma utsteinense]